MESYAIMLVDDERFVVDWLCELLETHLDGEHAFYRAYSAERALRIAERTRIDLLITDINMPGASGLDLIEEINKRWPLCMCILLTGHADFAYAQSAISKGVMGYLLKISSDDAIVAEAGKALRAIEETIQNRSLLNHMQKDLDNHIAQLKRQVFFTWIRGNHQSEEELRYYQEVLGLHQGDGRFFLLMGSAVRLDAQARPYLTDSISYFRMKSIINHYLSLHVEHYAAELANDRVIWILRPSSEVEPHFDQLLMGVLEIAQRSCREVAGMSVSFVFGDPVGNPADLPEQYVSLGAMLDTLPRDGELIYQKSLASAHPDASEGFTPYKLNLSPILLKFLVNGARDEYFKTIGAVCDNIAKNPNWHNSLVSHQYFSMVQAIMEYINQSGRSDTTLARNAVRELYAPAQAASFAALRQCLFSVSEALFALKDESHKGSAEAIVDTVKAYVDAHVAEDIFLVDLSELTGYSAAYLSRLFSRVTGVTISSYIAGQRIAYIKRRMQDSSLSIAEIAAAAGFHSRTYFNSFFKRNVGVTPQAYRESLQAEAEGG